LAANPEAAIITYEERKDLTYPEGHPFRPERAFMFMDILAREGVRGEPWLREVKAVPATFDELARFHAPDYLRLLEDASRGEMSLDMLMAGLGSADCPVFAGLHELAALAAGGTLQGARMLDAGEADVVFNPIGGFHHAGTAHAEGFCYVNDVVLACLWLADRGKKVACVDLDVHHGNGTEDALIGDARVLKVSLHESGRTLYPGGGFETRIGEGAAQGLNVNVPLPAGTDDDAFLKAFRGVVMPLLGAYGPDVVVLEIGMDVLAGDPLGHLRMTNNATADASTLVRGLGKPLLVLGGGGYHPHNTARGWAVAFMSMCGVDTEDAYAGLVGGVFLGDCGRRGGLRDMRVYASGNERAAIEAEAERVIAFHRATTFPIHGI
jgi:acetoin utilization deacetylase AcuC-like enzyme